MAVRIEETAAVRPITNIVCTLLHHPVASISVALMLFLLQLTPASAGAADPSGQESSVRQDSDMSLPAVASPVQIPFTYRNAHIIVGASLNNSNPLNFLIDTGASGIIIDQRTAGDAGLPLEQTLTVESAAGQVAVRSSRIAQMKLGTLTLTQVPAFIADLSTQSMQYGCTISGIIGARLLNRFVVTIDYGSQTLELANTAPETLSPDTQSIPLVKDEPPLVYGTLNGQYRQIFLIDTGSTINSLPADLVTRLRMPPSPITASGTGLDGRQLRLNTCVLKSIELGKVIKHNVLCHFASTERSEKFAKGFFLSSNIAVLGNPFWEDYKITLDYRQHKLYVQPGVVQGVRREIMDSIAQGDSALNYQRRFRQAESCYNNALAKVNFANDPKYEALALERLANLRRVMSKDLQRPEHAKAAYDYFVKALDLARGINDKDLEARILADWSLLYSDNGQDTEAWQTIQTAALLSPDNVEVMVDQSVLLFRASTYSDMQALLKEILARDPSNWHALWYQVKLDQINGNSDDLSYTLKQILQYYPWSKTAKDTLASMKNKPGDSSTPKQTGAQDYVLHR